MRRLLPLAVVLAAVVPLLAADPKIDGLVKVEPYKVIKLTAKDMDPKTDSAIWKVRPLDPANEGKVSFATAEAEDRIEWVAPPGKYRVELTVGRHKDGKLKLIGDEVVLTIGDPPAPVPPTPPVPPVPPVPPTPDADKALTDKLVAAVKPEEKKWLTALGDVYITTGVLLPQLKDPAVRPKTVQAVIDRLTEASVAADVPRLPALLGVRTVVDADIGKYEASAPITDALADELGKKYQRVGAALKAAGK